MSILETIKRNRLQLNNDLNSVEKRRWFSPLEYAGYSLLMEEIPKHAKGAAIDLGCGDLQNKPLLEKYVDQYDSIDIDKRSDNITYVGDIQNMDVIPDEVYDSAFCFSVLEHVPEPGDALREAYRILKPGGKLMLAVPHISRLHEEPHDYYRFTKYGLKHLLEKTGFDILELRPSGGLFSFVGHQVSTVLLGLTWHIPIVKDVVFFMNKCLVVIPAVWLDNKFDKTGIMACDHFAAVKKPNR